MDDDSAVIDVEGRLGPSGCSATSERPSKRLVKVASPSCGRRKAAVRRLPRRKCLIDSLMRHRGVVAGALAQAVREEGVHLDGHREIHESGDISSQV